MKMESMPLVSIIVPIYKVEPYIYQCVTSLLSQDYRNIEIILVDDGSPDNSGAMIDEFAKRDVRVVVIHKQNGGVSAARNDGLAVASGDYLMFVDGDDYVEPDYVSYFVSMMGDRGRGIGVGKNAFHREDLPQPEDSIRVLDALEIVEGIYLNHYGVAVWNKIYRRDIVIEHNLRFNTEFWYGEGMLFNIQYLQYVDQAAVGERRVYHIRPNPESATRNFKLENQYCGLRSMEYQKAHWERENQRIKMAWEYHYRLYAKSILQGLIATNGKKNYKRLYRKCIHILRTNLRIPLQAEISDNMKENSILMAICPTGFIRDELNIQHVKGDQSDFISRRLLRQARRRFSKISPEKKAEFYSRNQKRLQKRYHPVYMEKSLL